MSTGSTVIRDRTKEILSSLANFFTGILIVAGGTFSIYAFWHYQNLGGVLGLLLAVFVILNSYCGSSWFGIWHGWLFGIGLLLLGNCIFLPASIDAVGKKWLVNDQQIGSYQIAVPFFNDIKDVHLLHSFARSENWDEQIRTYAWTKDGFKVRGLVSCQFYGPLSDRAIIAIAKEGDPDTVIRNAITQAANEQFAFAVSKLTRQELKETLLLETEVGIGVDDVAGNYQLRWEGDRTLVVRDIHAFYGHEGGPRP